MPTPSATAPPITLKHWVNRLLNDQTYPPHQSFERFIYGLILLSVGLLAVEFAWFPTGRIPGPMLIADQVILAIFALEYVGRLWVVEAELPATTRVGWRQRFMYTAAAKLGWALEPYHIIDLIAILPLFPFLRSLRVLRVLRLFTHTSLTQRVFHYFNPFAAAGQTLRQNQTLYVFVAVFIALAIGLGAITGYLAEHPFNKHFSTPFDALWWATVTVTTVGYGDTYPITTSGRLIAMALMLSGFFIFALMAGVVSQTLVHSLLHIREEGIRMTAMVNQIVICGWNNRTLMLLREIMDQSPQAARRVVVFADREPPAELPPWVTFVQGDPTQEIELAKVRMAVADAAIVVADERGGSFSDADGRALLTIFTIRAFEAKLAARGIDRIRPIHVAAELLDPDNLGFYQAAGANEVIQTALLGSTLLARAATLPDTGQLFGDLVSVEGHTLGHGPSLAIDTAPQLFWQIASELKQHHELLLIGYDRDGRRVINPPATDMVLASDTLIYLKADSAAQDARDQTDHSFWGTLEGG